MNVIKDYADGKIAMSLLGAYDTVGTARDVKISADGTKAYVADETNGLVVLDITTATPTLIGSYNTVGNAYGVKISADGTKAYVAAYGAGLMVFNSMIKPPLARGSSPC